MRSYTQRAKETNFNLRSTAPFMMNDLPHSFQEGRRFSEGECPPPHVAQVREEDTKEEEEEEEMAHLLPLPIPYLLLLSKTNRN